MNQAIELSMIFGHKPELMVSQLEELGIDFKLVYLIDSYTRDNTIGYDDMAGFVFIKKDGRYRVYYAFQTSAGGDRSEYSGLKIYMIRPENLKRALSIIEGENGLEWINGTKNTNNTEEVEKIIEDIKKCEGM